MSDRLRNYIRARLRERGMSGRAAAAAMGVSNTYFVRVMTGKIKRPGVDFCNKLARLFNDSPIRVLRLAGWLPDDVDAEMEKELSELMMRDPILRELLDLYRQMDSIEERDTFLRIARAIVERKQDSQE